MTTDGGKSRVSGFSRCKRKLDEYVTLLKKMTRRPSPLGDFTTYGDRLQPVCNAFAFLASGLRPCRTDERRSAGTYQRYEYADEKREALHLGSARGGNGF